MCSRQIKITREIPEFNAWIKHPFHGVRNIVALQITFHYAKLCKREGIKVGTSKSKSARGLRDEQDDTIMDDTQDCQPSLDFVRDNLGDARALVVQSIYNARRAPAFRITASYYWLRAAVVSRCVRPPAAMVWHHESRFTISLPIVHCLRIIITANLETTRCFNIAKKEICSSKMKFSF